MGVPAGLYTPREGAVSREAYRQLLSACVLPYAEACLDELRLKLDPPRAAVRVPPAGRCRRGRQGAGLRLAHPGGRDAGERRADRGDRGRGDGDGGISGGAGNWRCRRSLSIGGRLPDLGAGGDHLPRRYRPSLGGCRPRRRHMSRNCARVYPDRCSRSNPPHRPRRLGVDHSRYQPICRQRRHGREIRDGLRSTWHRLGHPPDGISQRILLAPPLPPEPSINFVDDSPVIHLSTPPLLPDIYSEIDLYK